MIDELRLNTKLISFEGILGRRDYLLNVVYICMISALFTTPLSIGFVNNIETFLDVFSPAKIFWNLGWFLKLWTLAGTAFVVYINISNITRRLNDINGCVNKDSNIVICSLFALGAFGFAMPFGLLVLFSCINFFLFLFLLFKRGKITGNYPYDFRKEFNWGAFFGTWIWGVINKSYHALWMLILGFTPIAFFYQLLLGLKGNEWAYKNRQWKSDEEFKKSQENQTIGFVVLTFFIVPALCFVLAFSLIFGVAMLAADEANIEQNKSTLHKVEKAIDSYTSIWFEGHEITETENRYYVLPKDWRGYSFSEKKDILDIAAISAAREREKTTGKYSSKTKELPRTKIYSSVNKELLGEFVLDETSFESEKPDYKEIFKAAFKAYRFYKPTVLE